MATIALTTADKVEVIESIDQKTLPTGEDITAGQAIRVNTAGKWVKADAAAGSNANGKGVHIATRTAKSGESVTGIRQGKMDGWVLTGLAYGADVFLSDTAGALADAAGTTSVVLARVQSSTAVPAGTANDKTLRINCPL